MQSVAFIRRYAGRTILQNQFVNSNAELLDPAQVPPAEYESQSESLAYLKMLLDELNIHTMASQFLRRQQNRMQKGNINEIRFYFKPDIARPFPDDVARPFPDGVYPALDTAKRSWRQLLVVGSNTESSLHDDEGLLIEVDFLFQVWN